MYKMSACVIMTTIFMMQPQLLPPSALSAFSSWWYATVIVVRVPIQCKWQCTKHILRLMAYYFVVTPIASKHLRYIPRTIGYAQGLLVLQAPNLTILPGLHAQIEVYVDQVAGMKVVGKRFPRPGRVAMACGYGWMDGCMYVWMDGWMDGFIYIYI